MEQFEQNKHNLANNFSNIIFISENEFALITILKDKVFQLYSKIIKESKVLNTSKERYETKNYINHEEIVSIDEILDGILEIHEDVTTWLVNLTKQLPGFDKFKQDDLMTIALNSAQLTIGVHLKDLYFDNDVHVISSKGYLLSRNRMNLAFGTMISTFYFCMNNKLKQLDLSENEVSLYYPFALTCCQRKLIYLCFIFKLFVYIFFKAKLVNDKEKLFELKAYYTKMLLYEFKLNGRDESFLKLFKEVL